MLSKLIIFFLIIVDAAIVVWLLIGGHNILVLNPKGSIAFQQRELMVTTLLLMLVVVIPVFIFTFYTAWKYREGNTKNTYTPDWDHDHTLQTLLWAFPLAIIVVLSIINWETAHKLDPFKPIDAYVKPVTIQVVALRWKWLFIYPEQRIATVNFVAFPEKTPIKFELTADAPLNSFWIPQLAGQIYAMPGMSTKLHLIANETGEFPGSTAELSGAGFAGMRFTAKSLARDDFDAWVQSVKQSPQALSLDVYNKLSEPSEDNPPAFYSSTEADLYTTIVMRFMKPSHAMPPDTMAGMGEMEH